MSETFSPGNWQRIKELFNLAVEVPLAERDSFLAIHCGDEKEIRIAVEKLLRADDADPTQLDHSPIGNLSSDIFGALTVDSERRIGSYRILKELGRGGMGTVFEAVRDDDEFDQRVALKLIRRGMDTEDVRRRFRSERQILANLDHPNIAHLLDGGTTSDGLPYFVMEFVEGEDLLTFCNSRRLGIEERLALFRKICAAVSYAHGRLVVHRDLKPSNILITNSGEPKLLDFGISKVVNPDSLEQTGTATALGMMTPGYASPEQFRGEQITTATDVYSLGVILFELLTGNLPYEVNNRRVDEIARVVCDVAPIKPSDFVTSGRTSERRKHKTAATSEKKQRTAARLLRGDIDNVVLKALRKEPTRRYGSVEQFSDDIRRHLEGLPITARPDTFSYRAEKFVKRNRNGIIAAVLVFLTLSIGVIATSWQAMRAERERKLAEKRFGQVRELANNVVFKYYDEIQKLPNSTAAQEMLVKDALIYLDGLAQDAASNSDLQTELGRAYIRIGRVQGRAFNANLGDTSGAIGSYRKGIALLDSVIRSSNDTKLQADLVGAYSELATAYKRQGNIVESNAMLHRAIDLSEKFHAANPDDSTLSVRLALSYLLLGDSLPLGKGEHDNLEAFRKSLAASSFVLQRDPKHVRANNLYAATADRIGSNLLAMAKDAEYDGNQEMAKQLCEEATPFGRQSEEIAEKLIQLEPDNVVNDRILKTAKLNSSEYLFRSGKFGEALQIQLVARDDFAAFLAGDPNNQEQKLDLAQVYAALGATYFRLGKKSEGDSSFNHTFQIFDELIAHDPQNFEYFEKRLEDRYSYADELLRSGNIELAQRGYNIAFEQIEMQASTKDPTYVESLRGFYVEKLGDCHLATSLQEGLSRSTREAALKSALASYQKALDLLQRNGTQISLGITKPGKVEALKRKIERTTQHNISV